MAAPSSFAAALKQMPGVAHLAAIDLIDGDGQVVATIEHKSGQTGSLALYNHLGQIFGAITVEAARKGLELYAEYVEDARNSPGKHPNIDRLLTLSATGNGMLRLRHHYAIDSD